MILYYEFENRRMNAEVNWPKDADIIQVQLTDKRLTRDLPGDLLFDVRGSKIFFTIEDPKNKRLIELQRIISKRLQEIGNQV